MILTYKKEDIINLIEKFKNEIHLLYKQDFINYRGKTSDTGIYYTEIICEWLLENKPLLSKIPTITREESYKTKNHNRIMQNINSNREEEKIAKEMYNNSYNFVGKIIDYQTPLKNKLSDPVGKIDLLAYNKNILYLLELKKPDSTETMLRCVLEAYTYLKTVDTKKLLLDFNLPKSTIIKASPFIFKNGLQHNEINDEHVNLIQLMELLDIKPYYISRSNGKYIVTEK